MKTISIDVPDKLYDTFKAFLSIFNRDDLKIYADDIDTLTSEEKKAYRKIKEKLNNGDYSDFSDWETVKNEL